LYKQLWKLEGKLLFFSFLFMFIDRAKECLSFITQEVLSCASFMHAHLSTLRDHVLALVVVVVVAVE
jgi:hypothetical protein